MKPAIFSGIELFVDAEWLKSKAQIKEGVSQMRPPFIRKSLHQALASFRPQNA